MNRIFIKSVNWVGDAVLVTPTIRVLRRTLPKAEITLLARPAVAPAFEANPDIDRLWVADETVSIGRFREIAARIRREDFDVGFALPNSFGAALLLALGGVRRRVGYRRDARGWLLTDPVRVTPEILREHQVEYYLNLLHEFCDIDTQLRELVVLPAPGADEYALRILERHGIRLADGPVVAMNPGAAYGTAKRWLPERFAAVADDLAERFGARVVLVGSAGEKPVCEEVASRAKTPLAILNDELTLRGFIALCDHLHLFVGNDSGAMHIAAARGVPVVAVFGPTDPVTTAPYHPRAAIVYENGACEKAPCLLRHCPEDHECMKRVSVESVTQAVARQIAVRVGGSGDKASCSCS
ncbi:lipopolysaccharide heptosyltransferase II [Candidatus Sumerlaeota bacterium]|nr:lipopolysaccharide heptosyltransferase II [Candidatus Sumerlaeota bacterium]